MILRFFSSSATFAYQVLIGTAEVLLFSLTLASVQARLARR
jgi:hypothetical protein